MNDEKRAELLMDHYKDTFTLIHFHWKARNRFFLFILVLMSAMAMDTAKPGSLAAVANGYVEKNLSVESNSETSQKVTVPTLDFSAVGTLCWFVLLCLVIQYYQRSMFVDRQYNYISQLEDQICTLMGADYVTREGKAYHSRTGVYDPNQPGRRPLFLKGVGPLYVWVFPLLLCVSVVVKLWFAGQWCAWNAWFNVVLGMGIILYSVLYMRWVKCRK